jgi:hypothetical protein
VSSCSAVATASRSREGRLSLCIARSTICTLAGLTAPSRCSAASCGNEGSSRSPSIEVRGSERCGGPDPGRGLAVGELQHPDKELADG